MASWARSSNHSGCSRKGPGPAATLLAALLGLPAVVRAQDHAGLPEYSLVVTLDTERGSLTGSAEITTDADLEARSLLEYPDEFSASDPDLNDVVFPLRYPHSQSLGGMEISAAQTRHADTEAAGTGEAAGTAGTGDATARSAGANRTGIAVSFTVAIPERYGPFGRTDDAVVLLSGWHPVLPASAAGPWDLRTVRASARYNIVFTADRSGLVVLGREVRRAAAHRPIAVTFEHPSPPLLYFRPEFEVATLHDDDRVAATIVTGRGSLRSSVKKRLTDAVQRSVAGGQQAFLVLECPLRESLVIPFPGGILFSDMIFSVTPLARFLQRHEETVRGGLFAGRLLMHTEVTLTDALVAASLLELWRWEHRESRPDYIRNLMKSTEVIGTFDKIATDPQAHFEASMFFSPELPPDLERTLDARVERLPPPLGVARLIQRTVGWDAALAAVERCGRGETALLAALAAGATPEQVAALKEIMTPRQVDLVLDRETTTATGHAAAVCKHDVEAPLPVELAVDSGDAGRELLITCPERCCPVDLPASEDGEPDLLLDPAGVFRQHTDDNDDPRRNDRNYLDLKWIVSRPYFSMGSEDPLPSAGFELVVQPRYDLHNSVFIYPVLVPARAVIMSGWRWGFGRKVRPNFLAEQLSLAVRWAAAVEESDWSIGPALVYIHQTRQSRNNPFQGNTAELHAVPIYATAGRDLGARMGGYATQLFGRTPDHVIAARISGDATIGTLPAWESPSTGGIMGVRALAASEIQARHWTGASLEYRYMPWRDWNASLFGVIFLNGLQVAFFSDAATMADSADTLFSERSSFIDAGLGLRPHFQFLGFLPAVMSLDFAYLLPFPQEANGRLSGLLNVSQPF